MKQRYLLRHAKSSWKDTSLPDHDRPLAGRGRRAAKAIARNLSDHGIEPELVLCSTARRARETLDRIQSALGSPPFWSSATSTPRAHPHFSSGYEAFPTRSSR